LVRIEIHFPIIDGIISQNIFRLDIFSAHFFSIFRIRDFFLETLEVTGRRILIFRFIAVFSIGGLLVVTLAAL
jgi:hypothetical protein